MFAPAALFAKLEFIDPGSRAAGLLHRWTATARSWASTKQQFLKDPKPPSAADLPRRAAGSIVVDAAPEGGTVTALIQMQALNDAYLLVVRLVDPQVFGYYRRTACGQRI